MATLTLITAMGSALMAGAFFAFSTLVMGGLALVTPTQGLATMQAINIAAMRPVFLGFFIGTAALSVAMLFQGTTMHLVGGLLYLVGCFGMTIVVHVPWNNALAPLSPEDPASAEEWRKYQRRWKTWNHLRGLAALAATVVLVLI